MEGREGDIYFLQGIKFLIPPSGGGGVNQVCWGRISSCEEGKEI